MNNNILMTVFLLFCFTIFETSIASEHNEKIFRVKITDSYKKSKYFIFSSSNPSVTTLDDLSNLSLTNDRGEVFPLSSIPPPPPHLPSEIRKDQTASLPHSQRHLLGSFTPAGNKKVPIVIPLSSRPSLEELTEIEEELDKHPRTLQNYIRHKHASSSIPPYIPSYLKFIESRPYSGVYSKLSEDQLTEQLELINQKMDNFFHNPETFQKDNTPPNKEFMSEYGDESLAILATVREDLLLEKIRRLTDTELNTEIQKIEESIERFRQMMAKRPLSSWSYDPKHEPLPEYKDLWADENQYGVTAMNQRMYRNLLYEEKDRRSEGLE